MDSPSASSVPVSASASACVPRSLRICFVSDFFYPRLGGVELHQYQLAQKLIQLGHTVIVITGSYEAQQQQQQTDNEASTATATSSASLAVRQGVRYLSSGLKVYYLNQLSVHSQASLPTLFGLLPVFRDIALRERIDLVHGHQSTSALVHELFLHAKSLQIPALYTDHSLFGFATIEAIHLNALMKFSLSSIDAVIAVSHCVKENIVLRSSIMSDRVWTIPNAVDATKFQPKSHNSILNQDGKIVIVILSRLVYRKGIDLVVDLIPSICREFPEVEFLIGGSGSKKGEIDSMREKYWLTERVKLIGEVPHDKVREILCRGHIFLNCSLTEAFCIAILEALACGLRVVATRVGGVTEIIPEEEKLIHFADPNAEDLIRSLSECIQIHRSAADNWCPIAVHNRIAELYNWHSIAKRTEKVYFHCLDSPRPTFADRLAELNSHGFISGKLFCIAAAMDLLAVKLLEWWKPREFIEPANKWPKFVNKTI